MPRKSDEDLFRQSTMTFGDHLEELRMCLFWALLWLVGGFLLGLALAKPVVHFIQGPVEDALKEHYKSAAISELEKLQHRGLPLPGAVEQLAELVDEQDVLPEAVFIQPGELLHQSQRIYKDIGQQRTQVVQLFQDADPLLRRMGLPASDPKNKLSDQQRHQVSKAVRLLKPADLTAEGPQKELTQDDLDRIAETIEGGKSVSKDDLASVIKAIELKKKRFQEDLARIAEGIDLLDRTALPARGPHEQLQREDLARIFIWRPVENDPRIQTRALGVPEAFMIYVKAALLVGVLLASPGIFWHLWSFVAAGLYYHERRFVYVFGPLSLALFFAGAALVFFCVFKIVLRFLFTFNQWLGIGIEPRISEWLGFVLMLPLGFGIAFQLPLVMLFLERIGIFSIQSYLSKWRIAILVIFVLSMFLTPADPGSMLLMAIPLTVLYFGGVLLCRFMPRSRSPYDEPED